MLGCHQLRAQVVEVMIINFRASVKKRDQIHSWVAVPSKARVVISHAPTAAKMLFVRVSFVTSNLESGAKVLCSGLYACSGCEIRNGL